MKMAAMAFVAATVSSGLATPVIRGAARRMGALDHALSSRKVHRQPVPRLGGIAIVLGFYASLGVLYLATDEVALRVHAHPLKALGLLLGGAAIAALGVLDDLRGVRARYKLLAQFAVAAFVYWTGFRIGQIANPFGEPIRLGVLALPFTMLWIAGVINAINLVDGLDGLAGGIALIALAAVFGVGAMHGKLLMPLFAAALGGAVLGFLFYNFSPASIFMGDTGSMFLGFVLATTSVQASQKSTTAVALLVPIIALGIPIADTLLAMARRAVRGAPIFSADRDHIHHRLLAAGLSQRQTVLLLYLASTALAVAALRIAAATPRQALLCLVALGLAGLLALWKLGFMRLQEAEKLFEQRRRNLAMRSVVHRVALTLKDAIGHEDVWAATRAAASALGAAAVALHLEDRAPVGEGAFSAGLDEAGPAPFRVRFSLLGERPAADVLELGWTDGRSELDRDTEIAVELLCHEVGAALDRIRGPSEETVLGKVIGFR